MMQIIVALIFFYLFMISGNEPLLWIHTLGIKLDIGFLYGIVILLVLVSSSNAVNITDGLDGLAGSLSFISFITLGIILQHKTISAVDLANELQLSHGERLRSWVDALLANQIVVSWGTGKGMKYAINPDFVSKSKMQFQEQLPIL